MITTIFITLALLLWAFCVYKAFTVGRVKEIKNG